MPPTSAAAPANFSSGESRSCLTNPMLWNWNTIGVCFISEAWYIDSGALFATTCLAAFGLALFLQFARRASREWERHLFARNVGNPRAFFDPITGIELAPLQPAAAQPAAAQPADAHNLLNLLPLMAPAMVKMPPTAFPLFVPASWNILSRLHCARFRLS
ncbi:hypothetical protein CEK25_001526 [Fusarium fujikuroi]|nr:hypothetical protein CEK25_001526 [Fusarium fujikuroi]